MSKFIMLCGIAGVGKSSLAKELCEKEDNCVILSSDQLRAELLGNEEDQSKNGWIFAQMNQHLHESLKSGYSVIYDATNLIMKRRKALLEELKKYDCQKEIYVMLARPEILYIRDGARQRTVGRDVINKQIKQFQCPQYFEGWDKIHLINTDGTIDCDEWMEELWEECAIPHDNPHHSLSIKEHLEKSYDLALKYHDQYLLAAALNHDIGKPFCKTWMNYHGYKDDVAHYYGHENAGAYFMLLFWVSPFYQFKDIDDVLLIVGAINYHMEPYKRRDAYSKFEKQLDKQLADYIRKLHEIDEEAH